MMVMCDRWAGWSSCLSPIDIFVKHVYASASLVGAMVCGLLWHRIGEMPSMMLGLGLVVLIRVLSRAFQWSLPKAHD